MKPIAFYYLPLALTIAVTLAFSWSSYRKLKSGLSESILVRLRIILVNFRNIFLQLLYVVVLGVLNFTSYGYYARDSSANIWFVNA